MERADAALGWRRGANPVSRRRPEVSIVVPVRNRPRDIEACLRAIRASVRYSRVPAEVVVADDCSTDATPETVMRFIRRWRGNPSLSLVRLGRNGGPGVARNAGARRARAGLLVFIDSDCTPVKGLISSYVRAFARHPEWTIAEGPTYAAVPAPWGIYDHVIEGRHGRRWRMTNVAIRTDAFRQSRGFDPRFNRVREDTDFWFTMLERGAVLGYVPGAAVTHPVKPGHPGQMLRNARLGVYEALLFFRHPRCYLTHLKWIDGWALSAFDVGILVAVLWGILAALGRLGGGLSAPFALACVSVAMVVAVRLRHRRTNLGGLVLLAGESMIYPFFRLYWVVVGLVHAATAGR